MPRGRPRKPRLSRMDAAVDAMVQFGFPVEKVKKHVKELLEAYGGDDGWPFIEEYSYKELIDAILRDGDENEQEQVAEDGVQLKENSLPGPSRSRVSDSQQIEGPEENIPAHNTAGSSSQTIPGPSPEITSDNLPESESAHVQIPASSPADSLPPRGRFPCYGWIESDEEDVEFIFLKPASKSTLHAPSEKKRRSRWDVKPDGIQ